MWRTCFTALASVCALMAAGSAQASGRSASSWDVDRQLARGVNIIGYDPLWHDRSKARFKLRHFAKIHEAGFSTVRIVLQAFRHMDAQNRLSRSWFEALDWAINGATRAGLNVIVDEHDFDLCSEDLELCHTKLSAFWAQVAQHLRKRGNNVLFELLNEPHAKLDADRWNQLLRELIPLVRKTNPTRILVIGPTQWNNFSKLETLELPEKDRHIIVTFHYYDPMRFTHQGASWVAEFTHVSGVICCTVEEKAKIDADFDKVAAWSRAHDRPVLLGEFGAREGGDMPSRVAWTNAVARSAERHGFAWAYWQFDGDFVVWDMKNDDWVRPILGALIPEKG